MEKYTEAKAKEHDTMIRSRQIAKNLNLNMKIGDVEYQGDGNKAIFYYIADERVDFRQLIKVLIFPSGLLYRYRVQDLPLRPLYLLFPVLACCCFCNIPYGYF